MKANACGLFARGFLRARWQAWGSRSGFIDLKNLFAIGVVAGFSWLWFFGRTQPVHVVTRAAESTAPCTTCGGAGKVRCPECGGFGSVEVKDACRECNGTGRYQWRFGNPNSPNARCPKCLGRGITTVRQPCPRCRNAGFDLCATCGGSGRAKVSVMTVAAGLSSWEKFWKWFKFSPPENPPPQRRRDGVYPLVEKYVEVKSASAAKPVTVKHWGDSQKREDTWVVPAVIAWDDGLETSTRPVEFFVKNREVVGSRFIN